MASRQQYMLEILLGAKTSSSYQKNIGSAKNGINSLSSTAKKAAAMVTAAFAAVNVKDLVADSVKEFSDYKAELANSAAIAGATKTEYAQLEEASREAGKATTKTAQESAAALGYMALAGWDVKEQTSSLMPILKLSEATNIDLAETSDLVTDSMSALNLKVKELPEYLDMVTKENNSANTSSEQLMQAFIKTGGAARSLHIDVQETGIALGILANNGSKAEESGRVMNSILTRIGSNKNAVERLDSLGVSIFDAQGKFVGLEEALKRINKGLEGMSVEKKTKALKDIAGTNYFSKMIYLLDGVKEGAKGASSAWDELENDLNHADGSLDKMYKTKTDTMDGAIEIMQSAFSDAQIAFVDTFDNEYVNIINDLGEVFNDTAGWFQDFGEEHELEIHQVFETVKDGVIEVGDVIGDVAGFAIEHFDEIKVGIVSVGTAMAALNIGKSVSKISKSMGVMNAAFNGASGGELTWMMSKISDMSPRAKLAVTALGLTAGAIAGIGYASYKAHEKMVKAGLEDHFGDMSLSMDEMDEIAQRIVGKKSLVKISEMLESVGKTDESIEKMTDTMSDIGRISWKLNAGFKIDNDDKDQYKESIKQYVESAQNAVNNQGYTVSIATDLLLGDNSKIGKENDDFYKRLDTQLDGLQKKINRKIQKAVENGVDINTDKSIQKLLKKVNDITTAVTKAENESAMQSLDLKYSGKDLTADNFKQLSKDIQNYEEEALSGADEAYKTSMTSLNARLNLGDISEKKYNKEKAKIDQGYYDTKADALSRGSKYMMDTITSAYPEVSDAMSVLQKDLDRGMKDAMKKGISGSELSNVMNEIVNQSMKDAGVSNDVADQIDELFKSGLGSVWSDMEDLENQMKKKGAKPSKKLSTGITNIQSLSAVTGSAEDALLVLGDTIGKSDAASTVINTADQLGYDIPEAIGSQIDANSYRVATAARNMMLTMQSEINRGVTTKITFDIAANALNWVDANTSGKKSKLKSVKELAKVSNPTLHRNAKGGIYQDPILTTFAEEGAEAAVPLDGSSRAKAIWQQAGKILGMTPTEDKKVYRDVTSATGHKDEQLYHDLSSFSTRSASVSSFGGEVAGGNTKFVYSPTIQVKGNADEKVLNRVVKMSMTEFAEMMEKYQKSKGRVAFSGS